MENLELLQEVNKGIERLKQKLMELQEENERLQKENDTLKASLKE